jgi:pimeloyl-ACP methyl ester carboxylesterase
VLSDDWQRRGEYVEVGEHRLFTVDLGAREAPAVLFLHGFPSSSSDFHRVVDRLAQSHRVVLHDHLGFGLSDKPARYSYSLLEQAQVAVGVWQALGVERGHLVGHDYGTSVATELLALRERGLLPIGVDSVTLSNGSVLIGLAKLRLSQHIARSRLLGPAFGRLVYAGYFKRVMRRLWGDRTKVIEDDLDAMWTGIVREQGNLRVHAISSYIDERYRFHERWVGALERLDLPALVLWARRDPVAVAAIGEELARRIPDSRLVWLDSLGHYPMLEDPEAWLEPLLDFLHSRAKQ